MIVLTSINRTLRRVCPGDEFTMTIKDDLGTTVLIREQITVEATIDFVASYRFALDDGTCPNFHLCGIFGDSKALPKEFNDAVYYEDLPTEQYNNFVKSVGVLLLASGPTYLEA